MKRISTLGFSLLWVLALAAHAISNSAQTNCRQGRQIELLIRAALRQNEMTEVPFADEIWCASAAGLPEQASLEVSKMRWDALLHALEFRLQCKPAGDCLPFLVRLPFPEAPMGKPDVKPGKTLRPPQRMNSDLLVKPGQIVTLVWSEKGMHIERRVLCLDAGRQGQRVRTRTQPDGRIVPARVAAAGLVEAGL